MAGVEVLDRLSREYKWKVDTLIVDIFYKNFCCKGLLKNGEGVEEFMYGVKRKDCFFKDGKYSFFI